ncbi:hypothetical protein [Fredinandcohnia sp. 179-A 10B2 NHS]|uniref:hypothetical protein n=1 Tax=Fredinandcohnia sp. 179-A 10B2 NHS TaxID=3235176 RepID=UPI0039A1F0C1
MNLLYSFEGRVNPSCDRTHTSHAFYVKEAYKTIKVFFSYSPKKLEDEELSKKLILESLDKYGYQGNYDGMEKWRDFLPLQNHITLSFDDPNKFRGATHRHDSTLELVISEKESSPGIVSDINPPGQWKVMLNMHCVISEKVEYQLEVWGVDVN